MDLKIRSSRIGDFFGDTVGVSGVGTGLYCRCFTF